MKKKWIIAVSLTTLALAGCAKKPEIKDASEKTVTTASAESTDKTTSSVKKSETSDLKNTVPAETEVKKFPEYLAPITDTESFFTRWGYPKAMIDPERYTDSYIDGDKLVIVGYNSSLESLDASLRAQLFTFYSDGHHIAGSDEIGWFVVWKGVKVGFETGTVSDNELYIRFYEYKTPAK